MNSPSSIASSTLLFRPALRWKRRGVSDEGDPWFVFCRARERFSSILRDMMALSPVLPRSSRAFGRTQFFCPDEVLCFRVPHAGTAERDCCHSSSRAAERHCCGHLLYLRFSFRSSPCSQLGTGGAICASAAGSPTSDALNHTLLGSLAAFCSRSTSEAVSFVLAKVESAAILIASTVAVLADHGPVDLSFSDRGQSRGVPGAEHQDGPADQSPAIPDASVPGGQGDATSRSIRAFEASCRFRRYRPGILRR